MNMVEIAVIRGINPLMKVLVVILAGGKGTRLKLPLPKALAPALGQTLIDFSINELELWPKKHAVSVSIGVVVGHQKELVMSHLERKYPSCEVVIQHEQLGTAHALKTFVDQKSSLVQKHDLVMVLCADTPHLRVTHFQSLYNFVTVQQLDAVAATFECVDPFGYGRIVRPTHKAELGFKIVEEKDASAIERKIREVNSGFYLFKTAYLTKYLDKIKATNQAKEFYLTDMFQWHQNVEAIKFPDQENFTGVNTLKDLSVTNQKLIHEKIDSLLSEGVIFLDKDSVYIESQVVIGAGAIIHPNVHLYGQTIIGKNSLIEPGTIIKNSVIGEDVQILGNSYLEGSSISSRATIGPFARIRPESKIAEGAKVGNFVEVKKSTIGKNAKVSHLSYVGDATIGENSNIGCGFISVNYDGKHKHQTTIGKDSFIGSGVEVIAPITIGDRSFVAAGSTLNHDVPDEAFAIAREKQVTKQGLAKKFLKKS